MAITLAQHRLYAQSRLRQRVPGPVPVLPGPSALRQCPSLTIPIPPPESVATWAKLPQKLKLVANALGGGNGKKFEGVLMDASSHKRLCTVKYDSGELFLTAIDRPDVCLASIAGGQLAVSGHGHRCTIKQYGPTIAFLMDAQGTFRWTASAASGNNSGVSSPKDGDGNAEFADSLTMDSANAQRGSGPEIAEVSSLRLCVRNNRPGQTRFAMEFSGHRVPRPIVQVRALVTGLYVHFLRTAHTNS